jgi:hypothetical protein
VTVVGLSQAKIIKAVPQNAYATSKENLLYDYFKGSVLQF